MKSGCFIKLDRSITQHWLWNDRNSKPFSRGQAWIDLIFMANVKEKKGIFRGEPTIYKRGTVYTSKAILQKRWGWGVKRLNSFLSLLEKDEMAHTEAHTDGTTITLLNYDDFNTIAPTEEHTREHTGEHTGNMQGNEGGSTTKEYIKNNKNEKNNKNKTFYPNDEILNEAFKEYVSMRKQIKAPMTDRAITLAMKKLDELSGGDNDKAVKIVNQSVMNSWKGLFPLKDEPQKTGAVDWNKELEEVMKHARGRSTQTNPSNDGFIS